jgi:hypothetical protein
MKHENVTIGKDKITVYQAEDGGTGCVYKYIANKPGDLSSGKLYVLKRNSSNPTLGDWIQVPNSTKSDRNNTSSIAGSLGGTSWTNVEDIEWGPDGRIYFSAKNTGTIWRFKDNGTNVSGIEAWVTNKQYPITHKSGTQNTSFEKGIDNLVFDGEGNLWALQDDDGYHLWVIKPDHTPSNPKVELFATAPIGSEPTGLTFTPDFKYGFLSIQHPTGSNSQTQKDASGANIRHNALTTIVFARKEHLGGSSANFASSSTSSYLIMDEHSSLEEGLQVKIYPNPFESEIQINATLIEESEITIELVSIEGVVIRELMNKILQEGTHNIKFNDIDYLQNGVYLLRISTRDQVITKRIVHLKDH